MVLFKQVLDGIAFLHANGIMHRDIKPSNLAVQSYDPPCACIIDFGCATWQETVLYDWPGTVPYLAPEQAEGLWHGRSVDIWAMAIVGTELFGRQTPRAKVDRTEYESMHRWLRRHQDDMPIWEVCSRMLQWNVGSRIAAEEALHHRSIRGYDHDSDLPTVEEDSQKRKRRVTPLR